MPRKKYTSRSNPLPDSVHGSLLVTKFISSLMSRGKRSTAERVFYRAMSIIEEKTGQPGITVFKTALANAKPVLEVKSRRVGGATYQVPVEVRPERRTSLAIRWIIDYSSARAEKSMEEKLAAELIAASKKEGGTIKKREDTHKMAEANKAFAHYRW
ncbi:MAG: 30S ribosomal protein S7 [Candidatus Latescibacterota bacterium]|nr:MAG: 30S ribosomal protein S7 [Candidatus Latescibacterota bacterium]